MDEQIRIPVELDFDKGLAQVKNFSSAAGKSFAPLSRIQVNADGSGFSKTIRQLESQLKSFQNGLKDAGSPESFARLNRAIDATKQKMDQVKAAGNPFQKLTPGVNQANMALTNTGRVLQDLPYGFIGIQNNLNPLLESFQRLKVETGSTGGAIKALVSQLGGAGGIGLVLSGVTAAVSFLTMGFGAWTRDMSGSKDKVDENKIALTQLNEILEATNKLIGDLGSGIQFVNQLGTINIEILGQSKVLDLQGQSISLANEIARAEAVVTRAQKEYYDAIDKNSSIGTDKSQEAETKALDNVRAAQDKIAELRNQQTLAQRQVTLQKVEDEREANKKKLESYEKYVSDTIARAKELAAFFDKVTIRDIEFDIDPRDSRQVKLEKALAFIQRVLNERSTFNVKPQILVDNPILKKSTAYFASLQKEADGIMKDLQEAINKLTKTNPVLIAASLETSKEKARGAEFFKALGVPDADENSPAGSLTKAQKEAVNLATIMRQTVVPSFEAMFDAILAGKSPMEAFFNTLKQALLDLIKKLISAAVYALVLTAITGGSVKFGAALKNGLGFRAKGGPVNAGGAYVVGEEGPELFTPGMQGNILSNKKTMSLFAGKKFAAGGLVFGPTQGIFGEGIGTNSGNPEVVTPLDKLKGFFADMLDDVAKRSANVASGVGYGGGSFTAPQEVRLHMSGRDVVGVVALEMASQGRSF